MITVIFFEPKIIIIVISLNLKLGLLVSPLITFPLAACANLSPNSISYFQLYWRELRFRVGIILFKVL